MHNTQKKNQQQTFDQHDSKYEKQTYNLTEYTSSKWRIELDENRFNGAQKLTQGKWKKPITNSNESVLVVS